MVQQSCLRRTGRLHKQNALLPMLHAALDMTMSLTGMAAARGGKRCAFGGILAQVAVCVDVGEVDAEAVLVAGHGHLQHPHRGVEAVGYGMHAVHALEVGDE